MNMSNSLLQQASILLFLPAVLLVVTGIGRLVLHKTGPKTFSSVENMVFAAGIGFGLLSYSVFILGAFQCLYPSFIYGLVILASITSLAGWITIPKQVIAESGFKTDIPLQDKGLYILLAFFLCFGLFFVLTPAIGNDELTYHLAVPKLYIENHGFYFIPGNIFSNYPLSSEMLFLIGLVLQGDVLAKTIHFSMALFLLLSMWQFSIHYIPKMPSPVLGPLIFLSIPSVFINTHMAYNDIAMTFYSFLAFLGFMNWSVRQEKGWLVLCGVFSGLAVATKYSGLILPLLGCLGILVAARKHQRSPYRATIYLLTYYISAAIAGSPFYIKNWLLTGNPLYPFFYDFFGGLGWSSDQSRIYNYFLHSLGMGRSLYDYILLPFNLSFKAQMHSSVFDGVLGPIFILTLPFALGIKKLPTIIKISLGYCLFFFLFWASSAQQVRYLIPVFPLLAIISGYIAIYYYQKYKPLFILLIILIVTSITYNTYHIIVDFNKVRPDRFITGYEDKTAFLTRLIPAYPIFHHINTHLPENTKIFLIYMKNLGYLCNRPYYSDSMLESYTIEKILDRSKTPEDVMAELKATGFTHILYDINYILGEISSFPTRSKLLFLSFQQSYLQLVKADKNRFYLFKIMTPVK